MVAALGVRSVNAAEGAGRRGSIPPEKLSGTRNLLRLRQVSCRAPSQALRRRILQIWRGDEKAKFVWVWVASHCVIGCIGCGICCGIGSLGMKSLEGELNRCLSDPDPLLRETAREAKQRLEQITNAKSKFPQEYFSHRA